MLQGIADSGGGGHVLEPGLAQFTGLKVISLDQVRTRTVMDASAFKAHGFIAQPVVDGDPGRGALDGGFHKPVGDPDPIVPFEPTAGVGQHLPGLVMVNIDSHRFQQFKGGGVDRFDLLRCQQVISWNALGFVSAEHGFCSYTLYRNFSLICAA